MPQGKGTYGKQVGRPPAKHIITDKRKTEGHDRHNKRHADNPDYEHGKSTENFPRAASPLEYAPFKMKAAGYNNSPMQKNFGIGDSEMPIKTAPVKFGGLVGRLFGRNKQNQQPEQPQDPMAQAQAQPQAQSTMQQEMAAAGTEQAGGAEGGEVQPHGPEAHTGGAAPIGGMQKKKAKGFMNPIMGLF